MNIRGWLVINAPKLTLEMNKLGDLRQNYLILRQMSLQNRVKGELAPPMVHRVAFRLKTEGDIFSKR